MLTDSSISEQIDALDLLLDSAGWALVRTRLEVQLDRDQADLEREVGPEQTAKIRGQIARIRMMINLPAAMREEFRQEGSK